MAKIIDARGRSCPEPVVMTKKAIEGYNGEEIEVLVDAMVAVENIKRFVKGLGYNIEVEERDDDFLLTIRK